MSGGSITISYTTLAEIAVAAAVIGGVAFIGSKQLAAPVSAGSASASNLGSGSSSSSKNKKKKRAGTSAAAVVDEVRERAGHVANEVQHVVENGIASAKELPVVQQATKQAQPALELAQAKVRQAGEAVAAALPSAPAPASTTTNGTAKGNKKKNKNKSGNKTPPVEQKKDDMRDYQLEPEHAPARVMKIVGGEIGATPAPKDDGSEWEKADAFDDDGGEWESVVSKKPSRPSTPSLSALGSQQPARTVPGLAQPQTKKQRENAAKKAKEDAIKREQQEEQERRLKAHRDALARARAQEAALAKRPKPSSQNYFGSEPAVSTSSTKGNLHAGLDPTNDGSLVWD
ncbi:uncharacterized protein JCM15063_001412 [Sporobolomyces koalae]|uniref:uncharacterized protein n=1 Tax=Sporobolomyces koalae TaxID=500713 RepID=UPI00317369BF